MTWINASGNEMRAEEWADPRMRCFGMLMDGPSFAPAGGPTQHGDHASRFECSSRSGSVHPSGRDGRGIVGGCIDTNVPDSNAEEGFAVGHVYGVTGRSLLLFVLG